MTRERLAAGCWDVLSRIMNVGVMVLAPSGNIEFASAHACELLGCANEAALRDRWGELRRALHLAAQPPAFGAKPTRTTVDLPTGGRMRFLRLEIHPLADEGGTACLVLLKDRQSADALETDLLLASRMRSLVHVYRVLAHDLKAPLNAMQLTLELLADSATADDATGRRQRHVSVLREEFARLSRLLDTMLDQKEPLSGNAERFDLRGIVREISVLLAPQARSQRVEWRTALPETPVTVEGYRDRLKQAILNIAINGLEAMPGGGRLTLALVAEHALARLDVMDSGTGVPEDLLDEIQQIHFTTKKSGSGLGLYAARLVVESHGGEMDVRNLAGRGACIRVILPRRD